MVQESESLNDETGSEVGSVIERDVSEKNRVGKHARLF